ncbi:hypothetical protein QQF64_007670 [Cirrhinus molitorella]|uniref:peptidylprolyl isomerase n=1 Tax=Cirrhinus molitorella TaxID=172907 RepID=A0ABR3MCR5_9TELE
MMVKKEGTGTELPMTGDKVFVHYVGTLLDGTQFDSSRDRGEKFSFELGKGGSKHGTSVLAKMKDWREICQLICKPEYAYGAAGSPPKIPPNATLVFQVELFEFRGEDITDEEDGGIIRRIITKGEGYTKPNEGAYEGVFLKLPVLYCYKSINGEQFILWLEGSHEERVFDERELKFEVGDGESLGLPLGVEKALQAMEQGEEALFTIKSKYGYGTAGSDKFNIPPIAKLSTKSKAKESWEMNSTEKLEQSAIVKEKGTQYFKEGKYKRQPMQVPTALCPGWSTSPVCQPDEEEKAKCAAMTAHLNLDYVLRYLKDASSQPGTPRNCDKALELDANNEKALFRRGEALVVMKEFDRARADFQRVTQLYPANKAAKTQIALCQKHIKEQHEKDKRLYANMFQKFAERDAKKEAGQEKEAGEKTENGLVHEIDRKRAQEQTAA